MALNPGEEKDKLLNKEDRTLDSFLHESRQYQILLAIVEQLTDLNKRQ
jgi:hypothetical protein